MSIPNILQIGYTGMNAAKAGIATTGHNISNANTEGYSRQRVTTEAVGPEGANANGGNKIGIGTRISRVERVNDEYIEKQIRNSARDLSHAEEKEMALRQLEDIFNEMNGDGLNRLVSRFFNEFRKLSNEPESPAVRNSVREASQAMVNDFHRINSEVRGVQHHLDSRIDGYIVEVNSMIREIGDLNKKIAELDTNSGAPNDLLDKRDLTVRKLGSYLDISSYKDERGKFCIDIKGLGPLVSGGEVEHLSAERGPADEFGKMDGAIDIRASGNAQGVITHRLKGGKLGALLEMRDEVLSGVNSRLDELAYNLTESVNEIHRQGVTASGETGINFFKPLSQEDRATEYISLSDEILYSIDSMATAAEPDAPGDNRIALAISQLQSARGMNGGSGTFDETYNSIVSEIAVATSQNQFTVNQQKDIMTQLNKVRDQISGVSIDEETANLIQFQHVYDASAKVIQMADEMLKTILSLVRS